MFRIIEFLAERDAPQSSDRSFCIVTDFVRLSRYYNEVLHYVYWTYFVNS